MCANIYELSTLYDVWPLQIPSQLTPGVLPPTKVAIETIPSSITQNVTQVKSRTKQYS